MRKGLMMQRSTVENGLSNKERRRHERYSVAFDLDVYLVNEDRLLGQVTDISLGGMALRCNETVPAGSYSLRMLVSLESVGREAISFEARCVRSTRDNAGVHNNAAFEFQNLSTEALQSIDIIVSELSA